MVDDHHKGINDSWATERFGCSRTAYINVFEDKCGYQKREEQEMTDRFTMCLSKAWKVKQRPDLPPWTALPLDRTDCIAGKVHRLWVWSLTALILLCSPSPCVCVCACSAVSNSCDPMDGNSSGSLKFSRQVYWLGLPFPPPGDLSYPGTEPISCTSRWIFFFLPRSQLGSDNYNRSFHAIPPSLNTHKHTHTHAHTYFLDFSFLSTSITCLVSYEEWLWIGFPIRRQWVSLIAQLVKNPPAMQETPVQPLGWEDPLEKGKATHSSILAWRIPWTKQITKSWTRLSNFHFHFYYKKIANTCWVFTIFVQFTFAFCLIP